MEGTPETTRRALSFILKARSAEREGKAQSGKRNGLADDGHFIKF